MDASFPGAVLLAFSASLAAPGTCEMKVPIDCADYGSTLLKLTPEGSRRFGEMFGSLGPRQGVNKEIAEGPVLVGNMLLVNPHDKRSILESLRGRPEGIIEYEQQNNRWHGGDGHHPKNGSSEPGWSRRRVGLAAAHSKTQGDPSIVVAILDSGIDSDHNDFRGQFWKSSCLSPGCGSDHSIGVSYAPGTCFEDFSDQIGHGTRVSGIVGGLGSPSGIATKVQLMAVRVLDENGLGCSAGVAEAIRFAADHGADIINLSIETRASTDKVVEEAIKYALGEDVAIVAAAGNGKIDLDKGGAKSFPGVYGDSELVVVAALDNHDIRYVESNYGVKKIDLGAPGRKIYGTGLQPNLYGSGTSFAAPFVSGGLVLVGSLTPKWDWSERAQHIVESARNTDREGTNIRTALDLDRATSAPVSVLEPNSNTAWQSGKRAVVKWKPVWNAGACSKLQVSLVIPGKPPKVLSSQVDTHSGEVAFTVTSDMNGRNLVRLTCHETELHSYSDSIDIL